MHFEAKLNYLGAESFRGKKDPTKTFNKATFLDDTSSFDVFISDLPVFNTLLALPRMAEVICHFTIDCGRYTNLYLDSVDPVTPVANKSPAPAASR